MVWASPLGLIAAHSFQEWLSGGGRTRRLKGRGGLDNLRVEPQKARSSRSCGKRRGVSRAAAMKDQ
jgi:hypothetical protein